MLKKSANFPLREAFSENCLAKATVQLFFSNPWETIFRPRLHHNSRCCLDRISSCRAFANKKVNFWRMLVISLHSACFTSLNTRTSAGGVRVRESRVFGSISETLTLCEALQARRPALSARIFLRLALHDYHHKSFSSTGRGKNPSFCVNHIYGSRTTSPLLNSRASSISVAENAS